MVFALFPCELQNKILEQLNSIHLFHIRYVSRKFLYLCDNIIKNNFKLKLYDSNDILFCNMNVLYTDLTKYKIQNYYIKTMYRKNISLIIDGLYYPIFSFEIKKTENVIDLNKKNKFIEGKIIIEHQQHYMLIWLDDVIIKQSLIFIDHKYKPIDIEDGKKI